MITHVHFFMLLLLCHMRTDIILYSAPLFVQYTLGFIILGLRNALNQLSVPFPSSGWNLNWNCAGKPLTSSTIAIFGLGLIAKSLIEEIRKLAPDARIIYTVPKIRRDFDAEIKMNLEYISDLKDLASQCVILLPLCSLKKTTEHLISKEILACLKSDAGLINVSRGKIGDKLRTKKDALDAELIVIK